MLARDFTKADRVAFVGTDVPATVVSVQGNRVHVRRDDGLSETLHDEAGMVPRTRDVYRLTSN